MASSTPKTEHRVVVIGGGFGGLRAVRHLADAPCRVTLLDRRNHHLFQPLLYQVATGALSPGEIATPLRAILRHQRNAEVILGDVTGIDLERRVVTTAPLTGEDGEEFSYDTLVVAAGSTDSYFGNDEWEPFAPGLKNLEDALEIRRRVLLAFEAAEAGPHVDGGLTFVIIGAGPTGVEIAGQIIELARDTLRRDFRRIDPGSARVVLVEAADRVLGAFPDRLSEAALHQLRTDGVEVRLTSPVTQVDAAGVDIGGARPERIPATTVIWAAGVQASPLTRQLLPDGLDRGGRVPVGPDLTLPGRPEVFVIGDLARVQGGSGAPLPGVAPVAMQQGVHAAKTIAARLAGGPAPGPFRYRDRGNLATIGRARAVGAIGPLRLTGFAAWATWLGVHLLYLVGFQNRLLVLTRWSFSFLTRGRGARLISAGGDERPDWEPPADPPRPSE